MFFPLWNSTNFSKDWKHQCISKNMSPELQSEKFLFSWIFIDFFLKNEIKLILETYPKRRSQLKFGHCWPSAFKIRCLS